MKIDINIDEIRSDIANEDDKLVQDAMKEHIREIDRLAAATDDPRMLAEYLQSSTEDLGKNVENIRVRKPIAQLSSGSSVTDNPGATTPSLPSGELEIVDALKGMFGGNLQNALTFVNEEAQKFHDAQKEIDRLSAELRKSQQELLRERSNAPAIDGEKIKLENELQTEKDHNKSLRDELKAWQDQIQKERQQAQQNLKQVQDKAADDVRYYEDQIHGLPQLIAKLKANAEMKNSLTGAHKVRIDVPATDITDWEFKQLGFE